MSLTRRSLRHLDGRDAERPQITLQETEKKSCWRHEPQSTRVAKSRSQPERRAGREVPGAT